MSVETRDTVLAFHGREKIEHMTPKMRKAFIVKIQRYCIHDGPGIRATVFFKGCPLRCVWCSSPETHSPEPEIAFYKEKCIEGCEACVGACPEGAISKMGANIEIDRAKCTDCGECADVCPSQALSVIGIPMNAQRIVEDVQKDKQFYEHSGGGVTLSGGEPLLHFECAAEIAKECQKKGISVALDTCGHGKKENVNRVLDHVDLVLYDIKHMDPLKHKKYTGVRNDIILDNARMISKRGVPMIIRYPLVPGINDSPDNLNRLAVFVSELTVVERLDILPYHRLGGPKYRILGRRYDLEHLESPDKHQVQRVNELLEDHGLPVGVSQ